MTQIIGLETQAEFFLSQGDKDPAVEMWESILEIGQKLGNLLLRNE